MSLLACLLRRASILKVSWGSPTSGSTRPQTSRADQCRTIWRLEASQLTHEHFVLCFCWLPVRHSNQTDSSILYGLAGALVSLFPGMAFRTRDVCVVRCLLLSLLGIYRSVASKGGQGFGPFCEALNAITTGERISQKDMEAPCFVCGQRASGTAGGWKKNKCVSHCAIMYVQFCSAGQLLFACVQGLVQFVKIKPSTGVLAPRLRRRDQGAIQEEQEPMHD